VAGSFASVHRCFSLDPFHGLQEPISMTNFSEDPTLVAGSLLVLAGGFLIALRLTQQGKYLIYVGAALGLAATVVVVEWLWVTDNERIEQVVYDLRRAVLDSDVESVLAQMAPQVQYSRGDVSLSEEATRNLIRGSLSNSHFDLIRISGLQTSVGNQSRRGTAEFRVFARGSVNTALTTGESGSAVSDWSLGLRETKPRVWKVCRITPVALPQGTLDLPGSAPAGRALGRVGMSQPDARKFFRNPNRGL
jgi:hypothetical protein